MPTYFRFFLLLLLAFHLPSCGNEAAPDATDSATTTDSTETQAKEYCFYGEGLTNVNMNLRIKGNQIQGFAEYVTPKAGMTLYSNYNISGKIEDGLYQMEFTRTDSEDKQGLGEQFTENWQLEEGQLVPVDASVVERLKPLACSADARFSQEIQKMDTETKSYTYQGRIGKNMDIKLFLEVRTNPEDAQSLLLEGHYYYLSQGPEKPIQLEGEIYQQGMQPGFLYEVKDGATFGKFVIEPGTDFSQSFEALWVSADETKEYPVQFQVQ